MTERRIHDRGRRIEDCSPLLGLLVFTIYGICLGCIIGFVVGRGSL